MDMFPNSIIINIKSYETGQAIPNIAVKIRLFATHKNDYTCIPSLSDKAGIIEIKKDWLNKEVEKSINLFAMDYSSTLRDCIPQIEIRIMDLDELQRAVQGWAEWKNILNIPQIEIDNLSRASNREYEPVSQIVNLNGQTSLEVELVTKTMKKK